MERKAQCHCGDLRLTCHGEPRKVSMCHCFDCQRRTGSAFSVAVFYPSAQVSVTGVSPERFERDSASGYPVEFYFCRRCGSNLFWKASRMPELTGVALGAFADPTFSAPVQSVWTKDKHHWISLPDSLTQFEHVSPNSPRKT